MLYIYIQKYKQQTPNKSKFPLNKTLTKAQKKGGKPKTSKKLRHINQFPKYHTNPQQRP